MTNKHNTQTSAQAQTLPRVTMAAVSIYDTPCGVLVVGDSRRGDIGFVHVLAAYMELTKPYSVKRMYDKQGRGCYAVKITF